MPHSSGGGSHGGGGHGGSHGGSHGRSGPRISRSHFPGSRRYVYYRHNQPRYFYADKKFKPGFDWKRLFVLLFYIPFFFVGFRMLREVIGFVPKNYDHSIIIEDDADVINNKSELRSTLESFMDKTGVAPSVVTVNNEEWQNVYPSLENYAYHRYLQEFSDEMHWLIVYSQPRDPDPNFNDWFWEGMQGDDTDPVLTAQKTGEFNGDLNGMLFNDDTHIGEAINTAFYNFTRDYKRDISFSNLIMPLFWLGFTIFHASAMLGLFEMKYWKAVPAPEDSEAEAQMAEEYIKPSTDYQTAVPVTTYVNKPVSGQMDDIYGSPSSPADNTPKDCVQCQYCGSMCSVKFRRCPNCNALLTKE